MTTKTETKSATLNTKELREALQKVNLIPTHKPLPITSNVLVDFSNGKAVLTTTNMEMVASVEVSSTNTGSFSILLPRKTTEKFLTGGNGKVSIEYDEPHNQIILSRDDVGTLNFVANRVSDFPPNLPNPDNLAWHSIDGKWFCSMLRIVSTACATEDSRPILTGVACNNGSIAAADGFRLKVLQDNRLDFGLGDKQAIIPLDTIILTDKLFRKSETIEVAFEYKETPSFGDNLIYPNFVHFKSSNILMSSQLIIGNYPKWEQLIPDKYNCKASFSAPVLAQRLGLMDDMVLYSGVVRYVFTTRKDGVQECSLSGGAEDEGQYHLTCPVKFEGDEAKIAFAHKYMADAIKPFSMCTFEVTSSSSPGKLTGDIEGLTVVIMPMFVQW